MNIPKLHYIPEGDNPEELLENIQKACTSGIELIQLKLNNISEKKFLKLATEAREITAHFQTRLIINEHYKIAKEVKADGVHLETPDFDSTAIRKYGYSWQILGGSASNLQDCETLLDKQVDYITLAPFDGSLDNGDLSTGLGLNGYTLIIEALDTKTPIVGFGGITTEDVKSLLISGISGIAISEEISQNFDSIKVFHHLLEASSTAEQRHTFE